MGSRLPRLRQLFPGHEHETLFLKKLAELLALHHIQVALTPGCAPIRMVPRGAAHFFVVVGQVHSELIYPWLEWRELLLVPVEPGFAVGRNTRFHDDDALHGDLLRVYRTSRGRSMSSGSLQKNWELVFIT